MGTTIIGLYWGILYWGFIGIMENEMETYGNYNLGFRGLVV